MQPLELTLVVAATRSMGIGAGGTMPWKGLRKEMKYFARVTTKLPPHVRSHNPSQPLIYASPRILFCFSSNLCPF